MSDKSLQHFIFHHCNIKSISKEKKIWRSGASIPVPLTC